MGQGKLEQGAELGCRIWDLPAARRLAVGLLGSAWVVSATACAGAMDDEHDSEDAAQTVAQPLSAAAGTRPLLVVTLVPQGGLAHPTAYYKNKIFGDPNSATDYSVVDYFSDVSHGRFTFERSRWTYVYEFSDPGSSLDAEAGVIPGKNGDGPNEMKLKRALYLVAQLTDLRIYDTNSDGVLTPKELTISVITPADLGVARTISVQIYPNLRYAGRGVSLGDRAAGNTIAHELAHTLGADDIYGKPSSGGPCNSRRLSLMSCTYSEDHEYWFGLDPWHLAGLNWEVRSESPRFGLVFSGGRTGWYEKVSPSRYVKLESPSRTGEYYILEWRDRTTRWDADVGREGVIAWYVAERGDGSLLGIESVTDEGYKDDSNFSLAPTGDCRLDPWDAESRGRKGILGQGKSYLLGWRDGSFSPNPIRIGTKQSDGSITVSSVTSQDEPASCN